MSVEDGSRALLGCDEDDDVRHQALELAGKCTVRPHYTLQDWDHAATIYERTHFARVARIPNGEAMQCLGGVCRMFGITRGSGRSNLAKVDWGPRFCEERARSPNYWRWFQRLWSREHQER
eukprot:gb/GFBE01059440.1/.p1 GENE.gb/GFBE01059440.1/~~gb/GFBE01059440.1/.p1  ORF type:complete len:121 (+),score=20.42 gb/GFBE01059440.1/:1-363(+)